MIEKIKEHMAEVEAFKAKTKEEVENFRIQYLGKKGLLNQIYAEFKNVSNDKKKEFGQWVDPELNDVPIAFLHQCDITGGNSGSRVMNAKGEIIGVAFDGNYEAMISDWKYDFAMQRTISVDIRYVLFITEKFAGADFILKEMGVASKSYTNN